MYADLDSMRALELAVGFSECQPPEEGGYVEKTVSILSTTELI
jgi:hypothetical protein